MEPVIIGVSQNIERIRRLITRVADTEMNIIVCGETGVGKELVVQSLYLKSNRVGKPFVKVNCAALPDTLLESEMFGYEKGAFTGADRRKRGKFEQASDGVLFLDEIGDMDLYLQSKLLHVLQDGDFSPLGSEKSVKTNAWVICATNHDLEADVENDKFRQDLYYRLSSIVIQVEPLRKRPEDIPRLIDYYIREYTSQLQNKKLKIPSTRTINRLTDYHWPGNVRELQNALKRILLLGDGDDVLDELISTPRSLEGRGAVPLSEQNYSIPPDLSGLNVDEPPPLSSLVLKDVKKRAIDRIEKEVIAFVLERTEWNRSKASRILDLSYKTLLCKIQDLNIQPPPKSANHNS
jgi:transcriptional regulator with GAF, ATPase, and Fis domain